MSSSRTEESFGGLARRIVSQSAIYGSADVFTSVVSLLLVPLYTAYLTAADYRVLAILGFFSAFGKVAFRLKLDDAFFRLYYDRKDDEERKTLAGTIVIFAGLVAASALALVALFARPLTGALFHGSEPPAHWVVLVAADLFFGAFAVVPMGLLRIQNRPGPFSLLSILRHVVNIVLKVVLITRGWGVAGALWADLIATAVFAAAPLPILVGNASFRWNGTLAREALRFSWPKVPHGLLVQIQNLLDRPILDRFVTPADVGVYQMGYTLGGGVKFATSAFEPAWAPFVYSQADRPDAQRTIARVVTYAFGAFVAVALTLSIFGRELLQVLTFKNPDFWRGAPLVPIVALAYLLHGVFLLTSIGIGVRKATTAYPKITLVAATTNVAFNLLLIPRFGLLGAAWATVVSYAVMAAMGFAIGRRLYPLPLEAGRLGRIAAAAALSYALSLFAPDATLTGVVVKACLALLFPVLLVAGGFLNEAERAWLRARLRV